jgi:hypothetical protein
MRRSCAALAAAALAVGAALSACGSSDSSTVARDSRAAAGPGNALRVTDSRNHSFTLHPDQVACGTGEYGHGVEVVHLRYTELAPLRGVDVEVVPVTEPRTYSLPLDSGDEERGPRNAFVFVTAKIPSPRAPHEPPAFENSTIQELRHAHAGGRLTVLRASCHPARLELSIDGWLGSEYSDPDVRVSGGIDLTGS